jgi:hypothetical protein
LIEKSSDPGSDAVNLMVAKGDCECMPQLSLSRGRGRTRGRLRLKSALSADPGNDVTSTHDGSIMEPKQSVNRDEFQRNFIELRPAPSRVSLAAVPKPRRAESEL